MPNLFFQIVNKKYEVGSNIVTSNLSFTKWKEVLNNDEALTTAILDRLIHHSHIINVTGVVVHIYVAFWCIFGLHLTLIPVASTALDISDEEVIEIYKRRWDIEQGYKKLRAYFGFGEEENRIYEALIARISLSFLPTILSVISIESPMNHKL